MTEELNAPIIPVTLLTGFLGSGKSTLLTQILNDPRFDDTAVVVNEFGDVGLDGVLVEHSGEQLVEMTTGCLCCMIRGDIRKTLMDLHRRRTSGAVSPFKRLVVETTGLADPAPVLHTLMTDPRLAGRYMLGGVITCVDAVNGETTLACHDESVKQAAVADRIVLTKTDLARDPTARANLTRLWAQLGDLNPAAPLLERNASTFDPGNLFDTSLYDPTTKTSNVQKWLNAEAFEPDPENVHALQDYNHDHDHDHDHNHDHDINRHGSDVRAFSLVLDDPISTAVFRFALDVLIANRGADLLRVKGIVNIAEAPDTPFVIHGVQHIFHDPVQLDAWPTVDRRTKLVFITRGVSEETVAALFQAWQAEVPNTPATATQR